MFYSTGHKSAVSSIAEERFQQQLHDYMGSPFRVSLIRPQDIQRDDNQHIDTPHYDTHCREYQRGKYHCTVDPLFDFGLVCFANKNKNFQLSYSLFQASQTGGQWYSDTSPFSIPYSLY
jgi:hypothetical protein